MATSQQAELDDKERLARLWSAYEAQEKELEKAKVKIAELEKSVEEKDTIIQTLKDALRARDERIRDLELRLSKLEKEHAKCGERIEKAEKSLRTERERFAKLYALAEELEADLKKAREDIERRDKWFKQNVDILRNFAKILEERAKIIGAKEKV